MFVDITISVPKTSHTKIHKFLAATDRPTARESATSIKDLDSETEKCVVV